MITTFEIDVDSSRLKKARETYKKEVFFARQELNEVERTQYIKCKKCNKKSQVKKFEYSNFYWYEQPHGCMGGDNWNEAGIYLKCPKCGNIEKINMPLNWASEKEKVKYNKLHNLIKNHSIKCDDIYEK